MHLLQCCSHRTSRGVCNDAGLSIWLLETAEIFLGAFCSVVTWRFTVQSESLHERVVSTSPLGMFLYPSPELMLCSCLIFGCCVSSFAHRRQGQDMLQFPIYAAGLAGGVTAGYVFKASTNLILLGYLPWAMCVAMAVSLFGHSLFRSMRLGSVQRSVDEEKTRLHW